MANAKLGRPTKERKAMLRGLATALLWNGKVETTVAKAKSLQSEVEKCITLAKNTYTDTVKVTKNIKTVTKTKGKDGKVTKTASVVAKEVINDGPKKLAARKKLMGKLYDVQEQRLPKESMEAYKARVEGINHPLMEKIFNVYAPKYAERNGGYTRITKLGARRGDAAEMALVELV